jgi:hypothetical protein
MVTGHQPFRFAGYADPQLKAMNKRFAVKEWSPATHCSSKKMHVWLTATGWSITPALVARYGLAGTIRSPSS